MKTTARHFKQFQQYCRDWQKQLGLMSYKLYFRHESLEGKYAEPRPLNARELNLLAKHEMLHLVLGELYVLAGDRHASEDSLDRAEHAVVVMLEQIIPNA